jgi:hypothetical protein
VPKKLLKETLPYAVGPRAAAPSMPGFLACWDAMQRSAQKKILSKEPFTFRSLLGKASKSIHASSPDHFLLVARCALIPAEVTHEQIGCNNIAADLCGFSRPGIARPHR